MDFEPPPPKTSSSAAWAVVVLLPPIAGVAAFVACLNLGLSPLLALLGMFSSIYLPALSIFRPRNEDGVAYFKAGVLVVTVCALWILVGSAVLYAMCGVGRTKHW